jgi:putative copper resistance protein D
MPHGLPHPARLGLIFLMLPLHAWLGIELMATGSVIAGDYYAAVPNHAGNLLADQHLGGALLWGSGDLLSALFFGALLMQWMRAEERAAARGDRRAAAAAAAGREGAELAAYNAYLARLHAGDRPAHRDS